MQTIRMMPGRGQTKRWSDSRYTFKVVPTKRLADGLDFGAGEGEWRGS